MFGAGHVSRVRTLYKGLLRLHRGLPMELQALGNEYMKNEFKRHKDCEPEFVAPFMTEWTNYGMTLAKQIGTRKPGKTFGVGLSEEQLNLLTDEQVTQLYTLFEEVQKPVDPDNPLGENPMVTQNKDT